VLRIGFEENEILVGEFLRVPGQLFMAFPKEACAWDFTASA